MKKTQIAITLIEYGAKVSYIDLERAFIKDLHQRLIGLMIDKLDNKKDLNNFIDKLQSNDLIILAQDLNENKNEIKNDVKVMSYKPDYRSLNDAG